MNELQETQPTVAVTYEAMSNSDLAENLVNVQAFIAKQRAAFEELMAPFLQDESNLKSEVLSRITQDNAKKLAYTDHDIRTKVYTKRQKRIDVLRRLEGLVTENELKKALYLKETPPEWVANMTHLKKLASDYGGDIAEIIALGTPEVVERTELIVVPREATKLESSHEQLDGEND